MKTTSEDFRAYMAWQKYILDSEPKLSDGIVRATLIAYCFAVAVHGTNGRDCYASNTTLAPKIGIDRDRLGKYRDEAVRLGWFTPTGRRIGRVDVLDVSIPADDDIPAVDIATEHDPALAPATCPACRDNIRRYYAGQITSDEMFAVHDGG